MFGGSLDYWSLSNETWEYDGAEWRQIQTLKSPAPRFGASMVYDDFRKKIVLFGGSTATYLNRDTWEYDGTTWSRIYTAIAPSRNGPMVYLRDQGATVLFEDMYGPDDFQPRRWLYDGNDWQIWETDGEPCPRGNPTMTFNPDENKLVLFGGALYQDYIVHYLADTWEYGL